MPVRSLRNRGLLLVVSATADDLVPPGASSSVLHPFGPDQGGLTEGVAAAPDGTMYFPEIPSAKTKA
jgi:hypothetical protein